jgi:hypothetical protein
MRNRLILVVIVLGTLSWSFPGRTQQLLESYIAQLSETDHFNSSGQRLTTAAAIIRQDRANFHRFGLRDPDDEDDQFFADEANRAALEKFLEYGRAEPGVISVILNSTPLVRVQVWRANAGPYIAVTLIDPPQFMGEGTRAVTPPAAPISNGSYSYVANTTPPDAFLSLRTQPSSSTGQRIMAMSNGTLLEVLQRRSDGWWYVRVKAAGEEGWALSGQGNRAWIVCCSN